MRRPTLACCVLALSLRAIAAPLTDAELDARVHALSEQLRCLVCQNQTLADSNAELAVDLRRQIREQLRQGASDEAVKQYLVQRYGDFVLYKPPLKPLTWLLWFGPLLLLLVVLAALWRPRARRVAPAGPLDDAERRRLAELLDEQPPQRSPRSIDTLPPLSPP
ncbi:cytochrome c-type biogenesis protein CcmH [Cupriavidus pinatubonensis]|uniref:cytochrome c-type biogenesis protein n=1 Tax=Cupriavidus pinatubonensis TaxID=248026 RepID=UPI00112E3B00|nr:cytochrome c-type biogenesis protein [Cupriavidus pinatubonensis]QYY28197.1 cytochrome c-type biogenesis protein CcmH [Cupriavidus pinatubonensis]TPQ44341.1 cytochrome c-type biogenesis protein CcmH [Cupriavidus pinatubonensis]